MSYQVLARKWRPNRFSELVGQEHVVTAISNALDNDRLHHAYLFTGTRGVGKTTIARIFSKSLNCEQGQSANPCGQCATCREIENGNFIDLLEIDAASRTKVEDTRELLDNVQYKPSRGKYKVYLIDEVHMLSKHSFNALLKTLEEPPPHVKFLLATTDPQKLPVTILSRCLQFNLKALSREQISEQLSHILGQEQLSSEPDALRQLARAAQGSMRDALSLTDQAIAQGNGAVSAAVVTAMLGLMDKNQVLKLLHALFEKRSEDAFAQVAAMAEQAPNFSQVLAEMMSLLHQIALTQFVPDACKLETVSARAIYQMAKSVPAEQVQLYYQIVLAGSKDLPYAAEPRVGFDMVLLRLLAFSPNNIEVDAQQLVELAEQQAPPSLPEPSSEQRLEPKVEPRVELVSPVAPPQVMESQQAQDASPEPTAPQYAETTQAPSPDVEARPEIAPSIAAQAEPEVTTALEPAVSAQSTTELFTTEQPATEQLVAEQPSPASVAPEPLTPGSNPVASAQPESVPPTPDTAVFDTPSPEPASVEAAAPFQQAHVAPQSSSQPAYQQPSVEPQVALTNTTPIVETQESEWTPPQFAETPPIDDSQYEQHMFDEQAQVMQQAQEYGYEQASVTSSQQPEPVPADESQGVQQATPQVSQTSAPQVSRTADLIALRNKIKQNQSSGEGDQTPAKKSRELASHEQSLGQPSTDANPFDSSQAEVTAIDTESDDSGPSARQAESGQYFEPALLSKPHGAPSEADNPAPVESTSNPFNRPQSVEPPAPSNLVDSSEEMPPWPVDDSFPNLAQYAAQAEPPEPKPEFDPNAHLDSDTKGAVDLDVPAFLPNKQKVTQSQQLDDWSALIETMNLNALVKQLALHSAFQKQDHTVTLTLLNGKEHLDSPSARQALSDSLSQHFAQAIQLNIVMGEPVNTPYALQVAINQVRQDYARQVIADDPGVALLTERFAAKVEPASISAR